MTMAGDSNKDTGIPSPFYQPPRKVPVTSGPIPVSAKVDIEVHNYQRSELPSFIKLLSYVALSGLFIGAEVLAHMDGIPGTIAAFSLGALISAAAFAIIEHSVSKHQMSVQEHYKGPKSLPPEVLDIIRKIGSK